jgi:hypothetical protein
MNGFVERTGLELIEWCKSCLFKKEFRG